mmetsp:Transcript_82994/g.240109  ORF Transcript_82994/g.240109 Transcript_82994/m.240109 type:complete len:225 (-) Transcript_82994:563-1237(-)
MPSCIMQSRQCHIRVTVSTRPRGQGWKPLQKLHFKTFGENTFQQSSQKNSSMSGSSQPTFPDCLHSWQSPTISPTLWVANSFSLKPSNNLSILEPITWLTVGFNQPSRMTLRCNDGKLTLPCLDNNASICLSICTICGPVIHNFPIFKGVAASRMASCNEFQRSSKSGLLSAGIVWKCRRSSEYVLLMSCRMSVRSSSWSAARIFSNVSSPYLSRFWFTTKNRV